MEKRDAIKIINEQHYIGYWFEEIENPLEVEKSNRIFDLLNQEPKVFATKEQLQGLHILNKPVEEKDFQFEFLKILFEKGRLNNKIDVTKTLEGFFPLDKYKHDDILTQDLAIKHFLYPLREDKLIKYDTLVNDNFGKPYICRWDAAITKDGIDFYLRLSERLMPIKIPEAIQITPHEIKRQSGTTVFVKIFKWTVNKTAFIIMWVIIGILGTVIGGLLLICCINYFKNKGFTL